MMTRIVEEIPGNVDAVWAVLADASTYPEWLAGAARVAAVDKNWPAEGSSFQHQLGLWPLRMPGSTTVAEVEEPRRLVLRAGMGLFGEMNVAFELTEIDTGQTLIEMTERPARGPVGWLGRLAPPVLSLALWGRNSLSLDRLRELMERHS